MHALMVKLAMHSKPYKGIEIIIQITMSCRQFIELMYLHANYHAKTAPTVIAGDIAHLEFKCPDRDEATETKRIIARPAFSTIKSEDMHDLERALCFDLKRSK